MDQIQQNKTTEVLLDNTLLAVYPILIEHIDQSKIWQILFSLQLSCKNISQTIPILIEYSLLIVIKHKNNILPPNVLSHIYPTISYSISSIKWCVPNQSDLEQINYDTSQQRPLNNPIRKNMVRKILRVKRV